jgi:N-acetylglucosaminyl-diphospho-decaprenol L-rhamnosyltransferase
LSASSANILGCLRIARMGYNFFGLNKVPKLRKIVFSLVSHGQLSLVKDFLRDFGVLSLDGVEIILTLNIPEDESLLSGFSGLPISIIRNSSPKGFGANHNFSFASAKCDIFVIVNPDIRLKDFSLKPLVDLLSKEHVGACAPIVLSGSGAVEDSVRRYPTLSRLLRRAIFGRSGPDYTWGQSPVRVDWAAGMFVAFRPEAFAQVGGFDEGFFLYYEDADICRRLARSGWHTMLQPEVSVIHDAQRASRHSFQHLKWHLQSIFRFLFLA